MSGEKMTSMTDEWIDQVRRQADSVVVIGRYVPLTRGVQHYCGACPFCQAPSPSFQIHRRRQLYHCFGCRREGDMFTFLIEHLGISFEDAALLVADLYTIPRPTQ